MELNSVADALSGLQANQSSMDVIGNNIANVNTIGYKTQSIRFEDLMNETLSNGSAAFAGRAGTDPMQVGLGVGTGSINLITTQGTVQDTGRPTDMAIEGNGYFVVSNGQQNFYTRDGSFTVSPDGVLENAATGMIVQGWGVNASGAGDTTTPLGPIKIPLNSQTAAATTKAGLAGNLDASQVTYSAGPPPKGGKFSTALTTYDTQGNAHTLTLNLQKTGDNTWSWNVTAPAGSGVTVTGNSGSLTFDATGALKSTATQPTLNITYGNGTSNGTVALDFTKITQLAQTSQVTVATADGMPGGAISTFNVDKNGVVSAVYSNGLIKPIAQVALADFRNPDGLLREGNNLNAVGPNSGLPQLGAAGVGTMGVIHTGQLEGSNVDLASQFSQMIQAQQGFNANTKVLSTTHAMVQSLFQILP